MWSKKLFLSILIVLQLCCNAFAKGGAPFNIVTDIRYSEIQLQFIGMCTCPRPPPIFYEIGEIWRYWEPFVAIGTTSQAFYYPFLGYGNGGVLDELGGKNASQDAANPGNESTFSQAHSWPLPGLAGLVCSKYDYPIWFSEYDAQWQNDELAQLITPEAFLYANPVMQMACMADAVSTNSGVPLDFLPWCIGSGGSSYPMNGHVDNDNIVQANNTSAARLLHKLCRFGMVCDPALTPCGCYPTPSWIKSHYKVHVVRPGNRAPAWPFGVNAAYYNSGLNVPFVGGGLGSNDEFLWVVYRQQYCCTCCD